MRRMSFTEAQDAFFADFFRLYPVNATEAGNHEHDHRWPDLTDAGAHERLSWLTEARATLEAAEGVSRDEEIDRRVLLTQIDALRFDDEELDELSWSTIVYSYLLGGGLFGILSREFAPLPDRLASAAGRMEGIPAALDAARDNLTSRRGRAAPPTEPEQRASPVYDETRAEMLRRARGLGPEGIGDEPMPDDPDALT